SSRLSLRNTDGMDFLATYSSLVTEDCCPEPADLLFRSVYLKRHMTMRSPLPTNAIECPLCRGEGTLKRTEILDRLGVKDFARVAQLSAEEAFRLLGTKNTNDHQSAS